jgi:LuxR family maltose regulon positive regulatory protein
MLAEQAALLEHEPRLQIWFENLPIPPLAGIAGTRGPLTRYVRGLLERAPEEPTLVRGMTLVLSAWLDVHGGEWERAERTAALAEEDHRWLAQPASLQFQLQLLRAQLHRLRGRRDALATTLCAVLRECASAEARAARPQALEVVMYYGCRMAAQAGDDTVLDELHAAARAVGADVAISPWIGEVTRRTRQGCEAMLRGRSDEALTLWLGVLEATPERVGLYGQGIEMRLQVADLLLAAGRAWEAEEHLGAACRQAIDDGNLGTLAAAGPAVLARLAASRPVGAAADEAQAAAHRKRLGDWAARALAWQRSEQALPVAGDRMQPASGGAAIDAAVSAMPAVPARMAPTPADSSAARATTPIGALPGTFDGPLSERETEVLQLIAGGQTNKVIARTLDISPHTVKRHVANILDKLALGSRGEAAAWYHANGAPRR